VVLSCVVGANGGHSKQRRAVQEVLSRIASAELWETRSCLVAYGTNDFQLSYAPIVRVSCGWNSRVVVDDAKT
jgi:hypothetical protein